MTTITFDPTEYDLDLPDLNTDLLGRIVRWAVIDSQLRDRAASLRGQERLVYEEEARQFEGWGHWNQSAWADREWGEPRNGFCGSAFCMAGQAVAQDLNLVVLDDEEHCIRLPIERGRRTFFMTEDEVEEYGVEIADSRLISEVAEEMLGLTSFEGDVFFNGSNQIDQIVSFAQAFAAVRGEVLDLPPWVTVLAQSADLTYERMCEVVSDDDYLSAVEAALGVEG